MRRAICFVGLLLAATLAVHGQAIGIAMPPSVGQPGKDVSWVPTPQKLVDQMFAMAHLTPQDYLIDLGSGDGRLVIAAAKRGARALGIEYDANLVALATKAAADEDVSDRASFVKADLFESDLSKATVITMFLLPELNLKLRPALLALRPGTRIVSNTFTMDDWDADETTTVSDGSCSNWCTALMWIVPAKVAGVWPILQGTLTLRQEFQRVQGSLTKDGRTVQIENGRVLGDELTFTVAGRRYVARMAGGRLTLQ